MQSSLMSVGSFDRAREDYEYIPARLVRSDGESDFAISWADLRLRPEVPEEWSLRESRSDYSSLAQDQFHSRLLNSDADEDLIHGLLSVIFWGFVSGTDGRVNVRRALSKSRAILVGRAGLPAQDPNEVLQHLRRARDASFVSIAEALVVAQRIKFLGMSFGSKLLMFMRPNTMAVYDSVVSEILQSHPHAEVRRLYVNPAFTMSASARQRQAQTYENWCHWCARKASELNSCGSRWHDWDGSLQTWRAVDVERAFFSQGRKV
ncbi:hypothetical protein FXB40_29820 [Bradyrhizobium rifense]|uniref:Uncharacterized protein n=1 Tax=Bradyrhizobium rifense TaxID=515499 RepID=A0A5D3K996_9BRAD|nr:hypothetical protein [Bradyrhizobium rifense]TYL91100.1 hypothetical protein FXB40_29820 [Bradyrhizobium rifense]